MSESKWLKEAIEKIDSKVDKLGESVNDQNVILAKQSVILEDHTRRSLAAEENLALLRKESRANQISMDSELAPIKTHVDRVSFIFKAIMFLASASGIVVAAIKVLEFFSHQ